MQGVRGLPTGKGGGRPGHQPGTGCLEEAREKAGEMDQYCKAEKVPLEVPVPTLSGWGHGGKGSGAEGRRARAGEEHTQACAGPMAHKTVTRRAWLSPSASGSKGECSAGCRAWATERLAVPTCWGRTSSWGQLDPTVRVCRRPGFSSRLRSKGTPSQCPSPHAQPPEPASRHPRNALPATPLHSQHPQASKGYYTHGETEAQGQRSDLPRVSEESPGSQRPCPGPQW